MKQAYDGSLQMFVEAPREPDEKRLMFLKWLIAEGRLESPLIPASETVPPVEQALLTVLSPLRDEDVIDTVFIRQELYRVYDATTIARLIRALDSAFEIQGDALVGKAGKIRALLQM